jgi:MYXO-CTERM domain-containing protein
MQTTLRRALRTALLAAPLVLASTHAVASGPLPHGVHLGNGGRYYQDVCDHSFAHYCLTQRMLPVSFEPSRFQPQAGSASFCQPMGSGEGLTAPPMGAMAPNDVLSAYSLTSSPMSGGKIVALVDMPDTNVLGDLNAYRQAFSIPALPKCSGLPTGTTPCLAVVDEQGNLNPTVTDCPAGDGETATDMDMISAACPDCSILLVQMTGADPTNGPQDQDFVTAVKTAQKLGAAATSISFGGPEQGNDPATYTQPGNLVFAATGDYGYDFGEHGGGASYPASAPDVVGVGGTNLRFNGSYTEVVWNDGQQGAAGSGCSTEFPMPSYQTAFLSSHPDAFGSCTGRASSDVSAAAEFTFGGVELGIAEYDQGDGWEQVVGTSAASPMVAAIFTRLGLTTPVSSNFGLLYENTGDFNDVTTGNNEDGVTCSDVMCQAGVGWDGPTGLGTPDAPKLQALMGSGSGSSSGGAGSSSGSSGDGGPNGDTPGHSGCSCAVVAEPSRMFGGLGVLALGASLLVARRRRR